jgi:hypothetical protein
MGPRVPLPALHEVFTPGGQPSVTYVGRDHLQLETKIRDALARGFAFTVVTGLTQSGKTVLCRRVLADRNPVVVEGGRIRSEKDFWEHVGYQLNIPTTATKEQIAGDEFAKKVEAGGTLFGLVQAKGGLAQKSSDVRSSGVIYQNVGMLDSIRTLLETRRVLFVDDFHYIDSETQKGIVHSLKGAVFEGLPVFMLAVPHRALDPVNVESELKGRFQQVSIPKWMLEDLVQIPRRGFEALNVTLESADERSICDAAFGNPLLVQEVCRELCLANGVRERQRDTLKLSARPLDGIYREIAQYKGFPTFELLRAGVQAQDVRRMLEMQDGGSEDIHLALIASVARLGPKNETTFAEIKFSLSGIVKEDWVPASGELEAALVRLSEIARDRAKGEPPIEWMGQEGKLIIVDPFLQFYLKRAFPSAAVSREGD